MFDKDKMVQFGMETSVQDVINELSKLDPNMQVCFCGQAGGFLHVDTKENVCSFDTDTDEEWYEKEEEVNTDISDKKIRRDDYMAAIWAAKAYNGIGKHKASASSIDTENNPDSNDKEEE